MSDSEVTAGDSKPPDSSSGQPPRENSKSVGDEKRRTEEKSETSDGQEPDVAGLSNDAKSPKPKLPRPSGVQPCPRCGSNDTKFCYYNNYNIKQPRYYCKSCQRYWTAGGALRDVPVGAGRRRTKLTRSQDGTQAAFSVLSGGSNPAIVVQSSLMMDPALAPFSGPSFPKPPPHCGMSNPIGPAGVPLVTGPPFNVGTIPPMHPPPMALPDGLMPAGGGRSMLSNSRTRATANALLPDPMVPPGMHPGVKLGKAILNLNENHIDKDIGNNGDGAVDGRRTKQRIAETSNPAVMMVHASNPPHTNGILPPPPPYGVEWFMARQDPGGGGLLPPGYAPPQPPYGMPAMWPYGGFPGQWPPSFPRYFPPYPVESPVGDLARPPGPPPAVGFAGGGLPSMPWMNMPWPPQMGMSAPTDGVGLHASAPVVIDRGAQYMVPSNLGPQHSGEGRGGTV